MTILSRTAVAVAFASILALASPVPAQTTGTLTHNGVAMPVKAAAAVAVLDAKGTGLRVYVLPFVPSAAQTALLQKESTLFLMEKKSAYGSFWLKWFFAADVGKMEKVTVSLTGHDVSKPNARLSRMFMSGFKGTLTGELKDRKFNRTSQINFAPHHFANLIFIVKG